MNNVNDYNYITNKMHEIFDKCVPMVKLAELYASGEHDSIVLPLINQIGRPSLCPATF